MESPSAAAYFSAARTVLDDVAAGQEPAVRAAAGLITDSLRAGGIVQAFGSGHSEALAMELAGRAGGLVPSNKIALSDLVVLGGAPPEMLFGPFLERDPAVAHRLYELCAPHTEDVFVIASNSGVNGCVVELAGLVKQHGHRLLAVTSAAHTARAVSRHPSGRRLLDFADVVLDNGAPHGDALLPLPSGARVCGISSVSAALLVQMVVAEVVRQLAEAGEDLPIYLSANIDGGDDHNRKLEARYAGRIRRHA